jgi:hypothetical protein
MIEPNAILEKVDESFSVRKIESHSVEAWRLSRALHDMFIESDDDYSAALEVAGQAKQKVDQIESDRKQIISPARNFVSSINDAAKVLTNRLEEAINNTKVKMAIFDKKKKSDQEEKVKALEEMADRLGIDVAIYQDKDERVRAKGAIACNRCRYVFEVQDESLVPREYMMVDDKKIKLAITLGIREIQGVNIKEESVLQIRRR